MTPEQEQTIARLKALYESGDLDKTTYETAVSGIMGRTFQAETGSGAIAQGTGATAVGPRGVNVGGDVSGDIITGNVYYGPQTTDPAEALRIYRQVLVQSSATLPLRGVDIGASDAGSSQRPLGLANVYVELDTTSKEQETPAESAAAEFQLSERDKEPRPIPALQMVIENRRLVLTGDPGSGKSTFVNHLAYCLAAHQLSPDGGWLAQLDGWPAADADLLPVVVVLRDFAAALPSDLAHTAVPHDLWAFITNQLEKQNLEFAVAAVEEKLQNGRVLLLLDGLDEVTTLAARLFVRDAVNAFAARYPDNHYLVTCRILSYQPPESRNDPDLRLPTNSFPAAELAPFDAAKIDRFIDAWYAELVRVGSVREQDRPGLVQRLKTAVRRPDLWQLAPNPLLLTVMALVHAHQGRLPDSRALLYENTINMLLWRWEEVKAGGQIDAPPLRQLLLDAGRADMDLKRLLWRLAYDAHSRTAAYSDTEMVAEAVADISETQLTRGLEKLKRGDWNWVYQMTTAMKLRAGLLVERAPGVFTFPHRTFQEYLAGAYLSTQNNFSDQVATLVQESARVGQAAQWWEVVLLAVGRLVHLIGDTDKPFVLVNRLCPAQAKDDDAAWKAASLAGEALLEMGLARVREDAWGAELLDRVRERLALLASRGKLTPQERAGAGKTLARLGDPRRGVGVRRIGKLLLPDLEFCYVPPGPFLMGEDDIGRDEEKPQHEVDIAYGYWIGRYPVTAGQFRAFVDAANYRVDGRFDRYVVDPDNYPARYVTWDDARAFCRWLTEILHSGGAELAPLPQGYSVTLPSEAEWEKAARGGILLPPGEPLVVRLGDSEANFTLKTAATEPNLLPGRHYPWGNEYEADAANDRLSQIDNPCAVGAFPDGRSPYGVLDMSGNVWEWTRSQYQGYFYDAADGREKMGSRRSRTVRGGYYNSHENYMRCSARYGDDPNFDYHNYGFRVLLSPFSDSGL